MGDQSEVDRVLAEHYGQQGVGAGATPDDKRRQEAREFSNRVLAVRRGSYAPPAQFTAPVSEFTTPSDERRERASRALSHDPMIPFWGEGRGPLGIIPSRDSQASNMFANFFAAAPFAMGAGPLLTINPRLPPMSGVNNLGEAFGYVPALRAEGAALMGTPFNWSDRVGRRGGADDADHIWNEIVQRREEEERLGLKRGQAPKPDVLGRKSTTQEIQKADGGEVDRILSQYGQGYTSPQLNSGDGEIASTPDILAQYGANERMASGLPGFLRRIGAGLRSLAPSQVTTPVNTLTGREPNLRTREDHANPLMLMGGEGADTMASWIDMHPGVDRGQSRPQDLLAPLGLSAMAPLTAVNNAAGIFGGRLARTADREALSRAEEMAGRGVPRNEIWDQTGWFKGVDGKWRFEIDDSAATLKPPSAWNPDSLLGEGVGQYGALRHPELDAAYKPDNVLTHVNIQPTQPVRGSYAEGAPATSEYVARQPEINVRAPNSDEALSSLLHEFQHDVQRRERFLPGGNTADFPVETIRREAFDKASREITDLMERHPEAASAYRARNLQQAQMRGGVPTEAQLAELERLDAALQSTPIGRQLDRLDWQRASTDASSPEFWQSQAFERYRRIPGEIEARNVEFRRNMSPEERRARPPWETQDVPDADQILRQYSSGPQMSASLPMDEASRLARAREMGFNADTTYYHGTNSTFPEFARIDGGNARGDGFYFTPDAASAGRYATGDTNRITPQGNAGPNVLPVRLRDTDLFDESAIIDAPTRRRLAEAYNEQTRERARSQGRELYPEELQNPAEFASTYFDRAYPPNGANVLQSLSYNPNEQNALLQALGMRGRIGRSVGQGTTGGDVVMFHPEDIRSTQATFDPAQRASPNLLAADNARASVPGVVAQALESNRASKVDDVLRQYSQGPQMSAPTKGGDEIIPIFRGESSHNVRNGPYYSPDREWTRQFTQSGRDSEIRSAGIRNSHVYDPAPEARTYAGDPDAIDKIVAEAKAKGFKAVRLDEGRGQPPSVYVFDRSGLVRR